MKEVSVIPDTSSGPRGGEGLSKMKYIWREINHFSHNYLPPIFSFEDVLRLYFSTTQLYSNSSSNVAFLTTSFLIVCSFIIVYLDDSSIFFLFLYQVTSTSSLDSSTSNSASVFTGIMVNSGSGRMKAQVGTCTVKLALELCCPT